MSDCRFGAGDFVAIPAFGGTCAEVLSKHPLGSGWQLWVRLPSGNEISVSCESVGPCLQRASAAQAGDVMETDAAIDQARSQPTFEEIDRSLREVEFLSRLMPGERRSTRSFATERPEDTLREVSEAYRMIRPMLSALSDSPFLRGGWQQALKNYVELMDSTLA